MKLLNTNYTKGMAYHSFTGQLQCAVNRIYAPDKPKNLKKAALILSSGSDHVCCGAIFEYQNSFLNYLKLEDMWIYSAYGRQNRSNDLCHRLSAYQKHDHGFSWFSIFEK